MPPSPASYPLVSVVVEGYNEVKLATSVTDVLGALAAQDYPMDHVELVLVGNAEQYREWTERAARERRFAQIAVVEADGELYYELKNRGVARASGEIVAFVDSDVLPSPGWLTAIVRALTDGADATAGISTFWHRSHRRLPSALLDAAASVSFGHVVGRRDGAGASPAAGIVAHNLAGRTDVLRAVPFRTDELGRNCSVALLYDDLHAADFRVDLVPGQRVAHSFSARWFVYPFHVRVGWEEYALRRLTPEAPNRWLSRTGPLEPLATAPWYVCLDMRAWLRFGRALGYRWPARVARWPLVLLASVTARTAGMVGGYFAILAPKRSRAWAEAQ